MKRPAPDSGGVVDLTRDAAVDVLLRVYERGIHLDISIDKTLRRKALADRARRFLTHLAYGTVRHTLLLDHVLAGICTQPLSELPLPILTVLRMGVFQALFSAQVTRPAMVHTSVDLAKRRGHAGLARLANAVLRRVPPTLDAVALPPRESEPAAYLSVRYSVPRWLAERWLAAYGLERAEAVCAVQAQQAPVCLRVNTARTSAEALQADLTRSGYATAKRTSIPEELTMLDEAAPLRSKWFQQGHFIVQDPASMLAAHLMEPRDGERVLDLCAAPGGKTSHLAQLAPGAWIAACDRDRWRLAGARENAARLGLPLPALVVQDGTRPAVAGGFDRVLVDAPCTGLGTLRRHPDLKLRLDADAPRRLAAEQRALLRSAIALCKNGGVIVYSVCTFTPEETADVVRDAAAGGAVALESGPEFLDRWQIATGQYQTDPSDPTLDGFFLTRFRKAC